MSDEGKPRNASETGPKSKVNEWPFLERRRTKPSRTMAITLKPSHFGSYVQSGELTNLLALCMSIGAVDHGNGALPRGSRPRRESAPLTAAVNMGWHLAYHDAVCDVSQLMRTHARSTWLPRFPLLGLTRICGGTHHRSSSVIAFTVPGCRAGLDLRKAAQEISAVRLINRV